MNANLHRNYMTQVLLDIFRDKDLSRLLAFKGGTALMLFHGLPRFSTDLDFNLLDNDSKRFVRTRLITETVEAQQLFSLYPLITQHASEK